MGFFDWIGDAAGKVWSGIKTGAGAIYNTVKSGVDWVSDKVQPIVKAVGEYGGMIPIVGGAISAAANTANQAIDYAKKGVGIVGKVGRGIGLLGQAGPKYSRM
jgi:hypothetical protein